MRHVISKSVRKKKRHVKIYKYLNITTFEYEITFITFVFYVYVNAMCSTWLLTSCIRNMFIIFLHLNSKFGRLNECILPT